jgi:hypothetical protein
VLVKPDSKLISAGEDSGTELARLLGQPETAKLVPTGSGADDARSRAISLSACFGSPKR